MTALALVVECAELLRPLVDEFGVWVVERAVQRLVDTDPVEQARIRADVRRALGVDSARSILSASVFAELFEETGFDAEVRAQQLPEETDEPERLAQVIPFRRLKAGGAA